MKALTVYQPWASFIIIGAKPFEFRARDYAARKEILPGTRIVIHASARQIRAAEVLDIRNRIRDGSSGLRADIALPIIERLLDAHKCRGVLELAAGLGTVVIGRARRVGEIFSGTIDSDRLDHAMYGWPMTAIEPFEHPIPCRGLQGFWHWPHEVTVHAV